MATRNELEALLQAAPLDEAGYLIYGDWLQSQGDPRGELIALDDGARRAPIEHTARWRHRREELLARHPELVPPQGPDLVFDWQLGFVRTLTLRGYPSTPRTPLAPVLAHPSLAFVSTIFVDSWHRMEAESLVELAAGAPRSLRTLRLGRESQHLWREDATLDLDPTLAALPQLEQLFAAVPVRFGAIPTLRTLELCQVMPVTLDSLAGARAAKLESLVLWARELRAGELRRLLETPMPALVTLGLLHATHGNELIGELAGSPVLRQLRRVRMWNAGLTAAGTRHLTRDRFGHLEQLDLSDPGIDEATERALADLCPDVRIIPGRLRALVRP